MSDRTPPLIPDHELLRCIGRGSYGEVWLARNVTGQYRAVKIVYRASFDSPRPFDREFAGLQKYEPISRAHPGLVNILHIGRKDDAGYFYYIMELADDAASPVGAASPPRSSGPGLSAVGLAKADRGGDAAPTTRLSEHRTLDTDHYTPKTLRSELRQRARLPVAECIEIGLALTAALEHLHQNGLVHRDIKPSNVIFVNGQPKLADIGLVTDRDATMSFVGTEGYVPREGPGNPQADIYGLGKVLYEIATGKDRHDFPELPTDLGEADADARLLQLNEVFLKSCEADADKRYRTATQMHADLDNLRQGKPVQPSRTPRRMLIAVATLGVAAALVGVLTRTGGSRKPGESPQQPRDYLKENCQRTRLTVGESADSPDKEFRLISWEVPANVRAGETVQSRATWQTARGNSNAVVLVTVIGDWKPDEPLALLYQGLQDQPGRTWDKSFSFRAPDKPGHYRLRWILTQAFRPITSFYSHEDHGSYDPGNGHWAETSFTVAPSGS